MNSEDYLKVQLASYWRIRDELSNREVEGEKVAASEWEHLDDVAHSIVSSLQV